LRFQPHSGGSLPPAIVKEMAMARNPGRVWIALLIAGFFVGCWGCQDKKTDKTPKENVSQKASPPESVAKSEVEMLESPTEDIKPTAETEKATAKPPADSSSKTSVKPEDETPPPVPGPKTDKPAPVKKTPKPNLPPPAAIPKVSLTEQFNATCLVKVGDELPEVELPGLDGNKVALNSLYGSEITLVFFWNIGPTTYAQQSIIGALGDMQKDFLEPNAAKNLKVVSINVGNKPEDAKKMLETSGAKFPNLFDADGNYFKSVATEKLPRVYLLDASGKILWFDIDYTRATRRQLQTAVKAVLEGKK
jgi:peroxiredoxin